MNWYFNRKIYNHNINEVLLQYYVFTVFISYGKMVSYDMNICYTLFLIIKSITAAETQEMIHEKSCTARQCKDV